MSDHQIFVYQVWTATLDNGTKVMFQLFSDSETHKPIKAQLAYKPLSEYTWGRPIPMELNQ